MGEEQRKSIVIKDYPPLDLLIRLYLYLGTLPTLPYLATTTHHRLTESSIAVTLTPPDRLTTRDKAAMSALPANKSLTKKLPIHLPRYSHVTLS